MQQLPGFKRMVTGHDVQARSKHKLMHRTETLDYGVVTDDMARMVFTLLDGRYAPELLEVLQ